MDLNTTVDFIYLFICSHQPGSPHWSICSKICLPGVSIWVFKSYLHLELLIVTFKSAPPFPHTSHLIHHPVPSNDPEIWAFIFVTSTAVILIPDTNASPLDFCSRFHIYILTQHNLDSMSRAIFLQYTCVPLLFKISQQCFISFRIIPPNPTMAPTVLYDGPCVSFLASSPRDHLPDHSTLGILASLIFLGHSSFLRTL